MTPSRSPRAPLVAPLLYWLVLVCGLAGTTVARLDELPWLAALWGGALGGAVLGHAAGLFRLRAWFAIALGLGGACFLGALAQWDEGGTFFLALVASAVCAYASLSERGGLVAFWFPAVSWMLVATSGTSYLTRSVGLPALAGLALSFIAFARARETRRVALWLSHADARLARPVTRRVLHSSPTRAALGGAWMVAFGALAFVVAAWIAPSLWIVEADTVARESAARTAVDGELPCAAVEERRGVKEYLPASRLWSRRDVECAARSASAAELATWSAGEGGGAYGGGAYGAGAYGAGAYGAGAYGGGAYGAGAYGPTDIAGAYGATDVGGAYRIDDVTQVVTGSASAPAPYDGPAGGMHPPLAPERFGETNVPNATNVAGASSVSIGRQTSTTSGAVVGAPSSRAPSDEAARSSPAQASAPPAVTDGAPPAAWAGEGRSRRAPTDVSPIPLVRWSLLVTVALAALVVGLRVARRAVTLRHLRRPLWREPVDQRASNLWHRVLVGLRDGGVHLVGGETPSALARRVRVDGLEDCAAVLERVRHGVRVEPSDIERMARAADVAYAAARRRVGVMGRAVSWLRHPLV